MAIAGKKKPTINAIKNAVWYNENHQDYDFKVNAVI